MKSTRCERDIWQIFGRRVRRITRIDCQTQIIPNFVQYLRSKGVAGIGPAGGPVYVGALFAKVNGGDVGGVFLGARTSTPGGGGRFGLFYTAVPNGAASTNSAWLYGLQQNAENRTNLALINTGEEDGNADLFTIDLFNGDTGQKVNTIQVTLNAKSWQQFGTILSTYAAGTTQGYARIKRTSGINPFITYSVVNDGATANARTGDGAFVQSTP